MAIEKEFAQVMGSAEKLNDAEAIHSICLQKEHSYLVRQLCWVLAIEGLDSYILRPRDPVDYELLVNAIRPASRQHDVFVVVGLRGPTAPEQLCNGALLPIVGFDQIWAFDREALLRAAGRANKEDLKQLLDRTMQMTANAGTADAHRAVNYLIVRYPDVFGKVVEANAHGAIFSAVETRPSTLGADRKIVDVILSYMAKNTGVTEKWFARVDVTEEFPFLVSALSPYLSC